MKNSSITTLKAITMLTTTMLGVGILYTPYSFFQSGTYGGCVIVMLASIASFLSIYTLLEAAKQIMLSYTNINKIKVQENQETDELKFQEVPLNDVENPKTITDNGLSFDQLSYAEIGKSINPWIGRAIDTVISLAGFTTCLFRQKYLGRLSTILCGINENDENWNIVYSCFVTSFGLILLAVGQVKNISRFAILSHISLVCISILCFFICLMPFLFHDFKQETTQNLKGNNYLGNFIVFILVMNCQQNVVPIFKELKNKSRKNLILIASTTSVIAAFICLILGNVGNMFISNLSESGDIMSILLNRKTKIGLFISQKTPYLHLLPILMGITTVVSLLISFTFQQHAVTQVQVTYLEELKINKTAKTFICTFFTLFTISCANIFVNIDLSDVFMLIGNFIVVPMTLIFPSIFSFVLFGKKSRVIQFISFMIAIFGLLIGIWNTYDHYSLQKYEIDPSNLNHNTTDRSTTTVLE